jgi:hypothetical protein
MRRFRVVGTTSTRVSAQRAPILIPYAWRFDDADDDRRSA